MQEPNSPASISPILQLGAVAQVNEGRGLFVFELGWTPGRMCSLMSN